MKAIDRAISLVGLAELANAYDPPVTVQAVHKWKSCAVPAERCPAIERVTNGQVRCEELRPDVDWSVLRLKK